jgi:hypothetical protein
LPRDRGPFPARSLLLVSVCLAVLAAWWAFSTLAGLPSLAETAQDLATRHYKDPDVPDALGQLQRRAVGMWLNLPQVAGVAWPLAVALPACLVCVVRLRWAGVFWAAAAASGTLVATAHPLIGQYDRLVAPIWIVVAGGLAVLVDTAISKATRPRRTAGVRRRSEERRRREADGHLVGAGGRHEAG